MLADVHVNTVNMAGSTAYLYSGGNGNLPQNGGAGYGMEQCPPAPEAFQQQGLQPQWAHGIDQNSVWAMPPPQQIHQSNGGAMQQQQLQQQQQQQQQQPYEGAQRFDAPPVGWGGQAISESRGKVQQPPPPLRTLLDLHPHPSRPPSILPDTQPP